MTINNFIDKCFEPYQLHIKELEQSLENLTVTYETLKLHDEEEISLLQAQIEKMKCCANCAFDGQKNNCTYKYYSRCAYECKNHSLWEIRK